MGSGETSPTMVTPHQKLLQSVAKEASAAVFLDTPFGFQENADDLTARIIDYFKTSVGRDIDVISLRSGESSNSDVAQAVNMLKNAQWLFAGPGSPTYALQAWQQSELASHVSDVLLRGSVVFASAAALTLGKFTVPVYEIYKVGAKPHWLPGLNILETHTGLKAAVIPHFDNSEGGNHDTRFCYLGERRLQELEQQLPDDVFILGIDEHTGVSFDLDQELVTVFGRGKLTLRKGEMIKTFPAGSEISLEEIARTVDVPRSTSEEVAIEDSVLGDARALLDSGEISEAVTAILNADSLVRDAVTQQEVHAFIAQLGAIAAKPEINRSEILGPLIELLLELRQSARSAGRWDEADAIRDGLATNGIIVKDGAGTSTWELSE